MSSQIISINISKKKTTFITISSLIIFLLSIFFWKQNSIEVNFLVFHNFVYQHETIHHLFSMISHYGMSCIVFTYTVLLFLWVQKNDQTEYGILFFYILLCFATASIFGDILKEIINRARPVIELGGKILNTKVSESPAFPSGHATKVMALALPFVVMAPNSIKLNKLLKIVVLAIGLLVSYSRIALQRHYLSDVFGGIAIALAFTIIMVFVINRLNIKMQLNKDKLMMMNKRLRFVFLALTVVLTML
ncbi:MAG: phosphatase PAP2 family protein [Candidatus Marinimicrobia bacterium]|nr:phosphatase PAP2 family protein [Candidatus Neomarinimicrobiota bacterium]